jgi:hypothetical protein
MGYGKRTAINTNKRQVGSMGIASLEHHYEEAEKTEEDLGIVLSRLRRALEIFAEDRPPSQVRSDD